MRESGRVQTPEKRPYQSGSRGHNWLVQREFWRLFVWCSACGKRERVKSGRWLPAFDWCPQTAYTEANCNCACGTVTIHGPADELDNENGLFHRFDGRPCDDCVADPGGCDVHAERGLTPPTANGPSSLTTPASPPSS